MVVFFLLIPLLGLVLLFLKDTNPRRKIILNGLLLLNSAIYLVPMILAYLSTPEGASLFNENTGGGAFLWFYMLLMPLCGLALLVLAILKIVFMVQSKQKANSSDPTPPK
ncbi:Hypothetical protein I595_972 [Croceitalea dokdonensis DOKDO 023]|uniref:Uncharacterized protein n=1 Tax=Croceitalea dokdonensis DOKDO 023 TaxID=1300341 RepID=A0A0P7AL32_9FLAO|nr:hypothetical protein [Croceitalea dokdonensis]KPM32554.1 Hypothetical protein I595_972 [Croceitalea dokdonensis DOKDO 023]